MPRPNPGDDSNPHSGEGGPRKTPAQLAADPAFTGTYGRLADAIVRQRDRQGAARVDASTAVGRVTDLTPLTIATGQSTNEVVELNLLHNPAGTLLGGKYLLCGMPYPASDATKENPSFWVSNDLTTWTVPAGITNPIFPQGVQGDGNNSDSTLVEGPDGTLQMYWNQFLNATPGGTGVGGNTWAVKWSQSTNGTTWSTPTTVIGTVGASSRPTCPAVIYDPTATNGPWVMYACEFIGGTCFLMKYTASAPGGTWTKRTNPTLPAWPRSGYGPYHLNAVLWGDQHHLLINDSQNASPGAFGQMFLAVSDDQGATFSLSPMLFPYTGDYWYRAALVPAVTDAGPGYEVLWSKNDPGGWSVYKGTIDFTGASPTSDGRRAASAALGISPYVAGDTFNRTATASALGTATSGQTWTVSSGTIGINASGQAYAPSAANNKSVISTSISDVVVEANLTATSIDGASILFRYVDASNFWRFFYANGTWTLQKVIAGSATTLGTKASFAASVHRMKVSAFGNIITCWANDALCFAAVTDSALNTATSHGIQISTTTAMFDDFSIRPSRAGR